MVAFYNEIDPLAAQTMREAINAGVIAPGVVDERDIRDIRPDELAGYTQCHFFAGIGVWSYALRRAGWSDDRPVWTGSCPCQPFSAAGKGSGFADERHLWPAFHYLIEQCRPQLVLGEQVASKDGLGWLDLVQADLEATGYASGAVDTCAAGFGAPHIRQRLYWCAQGLDDPASARRTDARPGQSDERQGRRGGPKLGCPNVRLDDSQRPGLEGQSRDGDNRHEPGRLDALADGHAAETSRTGGVADTDAGRRGRFAPSDGGLADGQTTGWQQGDGGAQPDSAADGGRPGPTNGLWRDADWLFCRDEKWRPVEPGTFPLVNGASARVGRLRGYGNAINAEAATAFIEAVMDHLRASERLAA